MDEAVVWHAVHVRSFAQALKDASRLSGEPALLARYPDQRDELYLRAFVCEEHAKVVLALAGALLWRRSRPLAALAAYPYVMGRVGKRLRNPNPLSPIGVFRLAADIAVEGDARHGRGGGARPLQRGEPGAGPLTVAESPLAGRVIFVEGAPRSGTTLLVSMSPRIPRSPARWPSRISSTAASRPCSTTTAARPVRGLPLQLRLGGESSPTSSRDLCDGVLETMRGPRQARGATGSSRRRRCRGTAPASVMEQKLAVYPDATYVHVVRERRPSSAR